MPAFPFAFPLSALSKPSDALPSETPPSPRRLHLTSHHPLQRCANSSSSELWQVLHPLSAHQSPLLSPIPVLGLGFTVCVCKGLNIGTSCWQFPAPKLLLAWASPRGCPLGWGWSQPHSLPLCHGNYGWEKFWSRSIGGNTSDGSKRAPLNIQLLGGSKPTQTPQVSPTTVAQRAPIPQRIPIKDHPH